MSILNELGRSLRRWILLKMIILDAEDIIYDECSDSSRGFGLERADFE